MKLDTNKIDDAVLALLYLGLHDGARVWKGFDWDALNRLHAQGYISDPRGRAKSVVFTKEGFERAERLLQQLFTEGVESGYAPLPSHQEPKSSEAGSIQPQDDWERDLLAVASDCSVSLSHEAVSSEGLYD